MRMGQPSHLHRPATPAAASSVQRARSFAADLIRQFPVGLYSTAQSLAAAVGFFAVMGGLYFATYSWVFEPFDLNGELTQGFYAPPVFSAGLLFAAGWFALSERHMRAVPSWAWFGIAGLFAFMGVDELATIHERLQDWTGVDWQLLYLPVVVLGAAFWLRLLSSFSALPLVQVMWLGGALAWFLAQAAEHFEFNSQGDGFGLTSELVLVEEVSEMIGSSLLLLAILIFVAQNQRQRTGF